MTDGTQELREQIRDIVFTYGGSNSDYITDEKLMPLIKQEIAKARIDELNSLPHRSVTALTSSVDQSVVYERLDELKQELEKL